MRFAELFESPDFGYTHFNNREADLENFVFKVLSTGNNIHVVAYQDINHKVGQVSAFKKNDTLIVVYASILDEWKGSGVGQLLYDRLISWAKNEGFRLIRSDEILSSDGQNAWKRLSKRYPVTFVDNGEKPFYQIKLSKIHKIHESPDFGYKNFVNHDKDISKLKWKIEGDRESGIRIRAVKEFYDTESTGINGNYEGLIIARPSTEDAIQVSLSKLSKASNGYWLSTGLGQMIYDAAIKESKKLGFRYFDSDYQTSLDAKKAWTKLSNRYPVQKVKQNGSNIYRIDLTKVK